MVSHIDDDHIRGILDLTKDLVEAKTFGRTVTAQGSKPLAQLVRRHHRQHARRAIGRRHRILRGRVAQRRARHRRYGPDAAKVLASVGQGMRLRDDARMLKLPINGEFANKLVWADQDAPPLDLGNGLTITVVGPMKPELLALQAEHDKFLKKTASQRSATSAARLLHRQLPRPIFRAWCCTPMPKTRACCSPVTHVATRSWRASSWWACSNRGGTLHVNILKVPHHGSDRIDAIFFRGVTADHYVFSGDGEHGNPERETLQMLLDECGDNDSRSISPTLSTPSTWHAKKDWNKEQQKERNRARTDPTVTVREDWSPTTMVSVSFFAAHDEFAKKLSMVDEDQPRVIDLLDEIGF